jgi:hypothetical protein
MHRRQVNTRKHKTELEYIGRAPFKRRPRSPASSLADLFRRSQQPRAAAKFLGLAGFPRCPQTPAIPHRRYDWSSWTLCVVSWKETAEAFIDLRHNHRPLKMGKARNIRWLKKRFGHYVE